MTENGLLKRAEAALLEWYGHMVMTEKWGNLGCPTFPQKPLNFEPESVQVVFNEGLGMRLLSKLM